MSSSRAVVCQWVPENRVLLKVQCQWSFTEVCSRLKFIYTQNSLPYKIFILSLNSNQNLNTPAPLNSRFSSQRFKVSFVPSNQEIVMQHFDLYNKYSILITISDSLKLLFREPRFYPSSRSSPLPLSRLKTPFEPPAHFALFAFEVKDPDVLDTANCLNSASSSSELSTISSQAFSCS